MVVESGRVYKQSCPNTISLSYDEGISRYTTKSASKYPFLREGGWWMNEMFNLSSHRQNNFNRTHIVSTPIGQTWTIRLDQDQLANIFSNRESKYCRCRPLERLKENLSLCQMRQAVWLLWRDHTQDVTDSIIFKFAACLLFGTHLAIVSWLIGMMEAAIVNCWW